MIRTLKHLYHYLKKQAHNQERICNPCRQQSARITNPRLLGTNAANRQTSKTIIRLALSLVFISHSLSSIAQKFVSEDVTNFWIAYDQIVVNDDTLEQMQYLRELYLEPSTKGLQDIIHVRRYSETEFLKAINSYPAFWKSIRVNTLNTEAYQGAIAEDLQKLKAAYPDLKMPTVYFTIGAFRTNGTIRGRNVLIGCELALADEQTQIAELPEWRQPFYQEYKPLENLALLCTHECIHTQQEEIVENLLSMCLYEGVAEFISCQVTGKPSSSPAIAFGKANEKRVVRQFVDDLYIGSNNYNWLWGQNRNNLKIRDLGYYIGYETCERYYQQATDKQKAIKELIELDYTDEETVESIVDAARLLPKPLAEIHADYESKRPTVVSIQEFKNGDQTVSSDIKTITLQFSEKLNGHDDGLDFGPKGKKYYPKVDNSTRKWGENNQSYSFMVDLEPGKKYQMVISPNFRLKSGIRLKPYLIEFQTKE